MSTKLAQIAKRAKLDRKVRFTSLAHLLTPEFLRETWGMMNRKGAGGVDGESIEQFESTLELRLQDICERLKGGVYQAPPVRSDFGILKWPTSAVMGWSAAFTQPTSS